VIGTSLCLFIQALSEVFGITPNVYR